MVKRIHLEKFGNFQNSKKTVLIECYKIQQYRKNYSRKEVFLIVCKGLFKWKNPGKGNIFILKNYIITNYNNDE